MPEDASGRLGLRNRQIEQLCRAIALLHAEAGGSGHRRTVERCMRAHGLNDAAAALAQSGTATGRS